MDEFDVYLARAYSGGQLPTPTDDTHVTQDTTETGNSLVVQSGYKRGRRHSSVGMRSPVNPNASPEFVNAPGDERYPDHRPDIRRKLSATMVMVAVEPPSPTELLQGHPLGRGGHRKESKSSENGLHNGCRERSPTGNAGEQKQFGRSRTAPVQRQVTSSKDQPRRRRDKYASDRSDSGGKRRISGDSPVSAGSQERKGDEGGGVTTSTVAASRPDRLLLTTTHVVSGSQKCDASPGTLRRRSTTCTPETQHLAISGQPSPATLRRNSCVGPLGTSSSALHQPPNLRQQSSPHGNQLRVSNLSTSGLLTLTVPSAAHGAGGSSLTASPSCLSTRSTSRRNSAITYLTDSSAMLAAPGRCNPRTRPDERRSFSADGAIVDPSQLQALLQLAARSGAGTGNDGGTGSPDTRSPEGVDVWRSGSTVGVCSVQSLADRHVCRVAVIGANEVGKSTLTRQLMTSEYLANSENYQGLYEQLHL